MPTPLVYSPGFRVQTAVPATNVHYNGFNFPPAYKSHVEFEPVMDDSGRVLKYLRMKLQLECFIFKGVEIPSSSGWTALTYTPPTGTTSTTSALDSDFEIIRQRLMEPGQKLRFVAHGVGDISIQDGETFDVDNGPKPFVLACNPYGTKLVYIKWEVTSAFANCTEVTGQPGLATVVQFPFSVDFNVTSQGLSKRVITGKLEVPLSLLPDATSPRAGVSNVFDLNSYRERIAKTFPLLRQFHREQSYDVSTDRKTIGFMITDTEINSDFAYGPGCYQEDVTLSSSSTLYGGGFVNWNTNLSGTIELMAGYSKSFAFAEIARLFAIYFTKRSVLGEQLSSSSNEKSESEVAGGKVPSIGILIGLSFSEELFGRTVSFEISWTLITTIQTLFKASGIFFPVDETNSKRIEGWNKWRIQVGNVISDGGGYQDLQFNQQDDIIVSLCIAWPNSPPSDIAAGTPREPGSEKPRKATPENELSPENSFIDYQVSFDVEIIYHSSTHQAVGDHVAVPEALKGSTAANKATELSFTDATLDSASSDAARQVVLHSSREPTYILHFRGHAIRANFPPTVPKVESYGGVPAIPYGSGHVRPRKLATGVDPITGKSYQLFGLMWHKKYILQSRPKSVKIKTDAHRDNYRL
jgi:hypothetical protein